MVLCVASLPASLRPSLLSKRGPKRLVPSISGPALLSFVSNSGGWVHPALLVGSADGGERGLFVTESVESGQPLAYVPTAVCRHEGVIV